MSIIKEIHQSIKCYHKRMPDSYLQELNWVGLLAWVHPFERDDFAMRLKQENYITKEEHDRWKSRKNPKLLWKNNN